VIDAGRAPLEKRRDNHDLSSPRHSA
jgi:hypothetical protein